MRRGMGGMAAAVLAATFGLALAASIAANLWLYQRADGYYRELNALRLDPIGAEVFTHDGAAPDDFTVVLLGDSRIADWPAPELPGARVINRGIGAQTSAQVLARYPLHVAPLQPDVVVVQVGVNDLKAIPIFPEQAAAIAARCGANLRAIVAAARAQGATVVLSTVFPPGELPAIRRAYWSPAADAAIRALNDDIRAQADDGVVIFDAAALLAGDGAAVRPAYQRDFLHLTPEGYAALNQALAPLLAGLR